MTYRTWRRILSPVLAPLTRLCHTIDPNLITLASLALAVATGVAFAFSMLALALGLLGLHVISDYLDGAVARASGRTSRLGDFFDHAADRLADAACLGGLAASGWVRPVVALAALAGSQFLAIINTQVEASTGVRQDPHLSRTDGHVVLVAVLLLQSLGPGLLLGHPLLDWALLAMVPFTLLVGIVRVVVTAKSLAKQQVGGAMKTN